MGTRGLALIASLLLGANALAQTGANLRTVAEESDFKRTGRYEEVVRLCSSFQSTWPNKARCFEFGRSPEGRPMLALAFSDDGVLDAKAARQKNRQVVLIQGGIHAGEIDGKDAGFWAARDLMQGKAAKDALRRATFVFVPVFNVDGHERFGPNHRPNQIGPEAMGWRTTAQNLNLNRDYVKAEAPEMQAMLRLLNEWDPIVYADLHVTDGAEFEHDISINVSPISVGDKDMQRAGGQVRDALMETLSANGSLPVDFYPSLVEEDDPASGFTANVSPPRFSHEYWARRNRIGVLVETHSWKNYKTRVKATYHSILAMVDATAKHGVEWRRAAAELDRTSRQAGGTNVVIGYAIGKHSTTIEFRGYKYSRELSPISGALMTRYDNTQPEIWKIPFYDQIEPSVTVTAPRGGYVVPAAWSEPTAEKLALHGVQFKRLERTLTKQAVQVYRSTATQLSMASNEGRTPLTVQGEWVNETQDLSAGSLFVPIAQPNSQLALILLEPQSADSLLAWGYFTAAFERKEYMEPYVAEQVAIEMMKRDPALKAEFERRVQQEPAFAANPRARLDFFYRRHSSWDARFGMYPVFRTDAVIGGRQ